MSKTWHKHVRGLWRAMSDEELITYVHEHDDDPIEEIHVSMEVHGGRPHTEAPLTDWRCSKWPGIHGRSDCRDDYRLFGMEPCRACMIVFELAWPKPPPPAPEPKTILVMRDGRPVLRETPEPIVRPEPKKRRVILDGLGPVPE